MSAAFGSSGGQSLSSPARRSQPQPQPRVSPSGTGAATPLQSFKAQLLTRQKLQNRGDTVTFLSTRLELELRAVDEELKADRAALEQYDKQTAKIDARREELRRVIAQQDEFVQQFDEQIGPFEERYAGLQRSVDGLHKEAKGKYDAAVKLLIDKLGYHPPFKRWHDVI